LPEPIRHDDFDAIFSVEKRRLYQLAFAIRRDRNDAENTVRETMYVAWRRWDGLRDPTRRSLWLSQLCLQECFRSRTKNRTEPAEQLGSAFEELGSIQDHRLGTPALQRGGEPTDVDLDAAYRRLSLHQRASLWLHHHHGYAIEHCAEMMGCRPATVARHIDRAMLRLHRELRDG